MSNELNEQERAACLKLIDYTRAVLDGKKIEWMHEDGGWVADYNPTNAEASDFLEGRDFRIVAPLKMRPFRDEELPELLGVKIKDNDRPFPRIYAECRAGDGARAFQLCTYFEGPHAGMPVGRMDQ